MNAVFSINTYARRTSSAEWSILVLIVLLGALLRFWGLSNIGLHGDEETMGLAVKGILEFGSPILPSGMYYARGLTQTFVMAASAEIFGLTEWALRFPSAVAGTVMIVASYFLGRRFLPAYWSLIFALIIALLPAFISASQTARMYVFYVIRNRTSSNERHYEVRKYKGIRNHCNREERRETKIRPRIRSTKHCHQYFFRLIEDRPTKMHNNL